MTYFLWTMVALFTLGAVAKARHIAKGTQPPPPTPGAEVTAMLTQVVIVAWAFFLLLA